MQQPSVMLVDGHDLFRAALRQLLEKEGLPVVADCSSASDCLQLAARLQPEVTLVDVEIGGASGIEALSRLVRQRPEGATMVLSLDDSESSVYQALRAGARGYALKSTPIPELAAAVRAVAQGEAYLSPAVAAHVVRFVATGRVPRAGEQPMSERELQVLRLLAGGMDNNQIAAELSISAKTVKNHVSSILEKLDMTNRVQAAVYAVRTGIA